MKDQILLNLISSTFSSTLSSPKLPDYLQSLKKHLYDRSFEEAFPTSASSSQNDDLENDQEKILEAYVLRWVPTRVLCYTRIMERITRFLPNPELRVFCIGAGCGSETLALQAALSAQRIKPLKSAYFSECGCCRFMSGLGADPFKVECDGKYFAGGDESKLSPCRYRQRIFEF